MRCKCCDADNAEFILDDWYCYECSYVIQRTIIEDIEDHEETIEVPE